MKFALALLLAIGLCSCSPQIDTASGPVTVEQVRRWSEDLTGPQVFDAWLAAVHTATNSQALLTAYAHGADNSIVNYLATQSRGALLSKLDTLARRTNQHPYTRQQLEHALRLKELKQRDRKPIE